jgi:hypothetical protein
VKPASVVRPGDVVEFMQDTHYRKVVLETPEAGVSKEVARTLYRDETPKQDREILRGPSRAGVGGRPSATVRKLTNSGDRECVGSLLR